MKVGAKPYVWECVGGCAREAGKVLMSEYFILRERERQRYSEALYSGTRLAEV